MRLLTARGIEEMFNVSLQIYSMCRRNRDKKILF